MCKMCYHGQNPIDLSEFCKFLVSFKSHPWTKWRACIENYNEEQNYLLPNYSMLYNYYIIEKRVIIIDGRRVLIIMRGTQKIASLQIWGI